MSTTDLLLLGVIAGTGAGLLAGLIGNGGGIVVVPAVYYGLIHSGFSADVAAHVAVSTSLATILWICIAPVQAAAAWFGALLAQRTSAVALSRIFACSLAGTGIAMLSSL